MSTTQTQIFSSACSLLFVPADRPERYQKALNSGADVVVIDLEDAVSSGHKELAREHLATAYQSICRTSKEHKRIAIRINRTDSADGTKDLSLMHVLRPSAIMVAKAESSEPLNALCGLDDTCLLPIIESAKGWYGAHALAQVPSVVRLVFGHLDFQLDLGMECSEDESELLPVRLELVATSRRAGIAPPVDGVTPSIKDSVALESSTRRAARLGFTGKLCIHPSQIADVHRAFLPSAEALARAQRIVVAAQASSGGAVMFDGAMIDRPIVEMAIRLLARYSA